MAGRCNRIITVGASSGGMEVLRKLVSEIPADLDAALFIVMHLSPESSGAILVDALKQETEMKCGLAKPNAPIEKGSIYVAPPDYHLLIKKGRMLVTKGARENRSRPCIDSLFRSAAVAYGSSVIGVVLSGMQDDGTMGLNAIKQCGGLTVVQDPADAAYGEMPRNALNRTKVDHVVPIMGMGTLLYKLVASRAPRPVALPAKMAMEARIAERIVSDLDSVNSLGTQVPYNCPDCGGVLWEVSNSRVKRYRCHVGHAYTGTLLLNAQTEKMEETLWMALRMFEERHNLLVDMSRKQGSGSAKAYLERADETRVHVERIREILLTNTQSPKNLRARAGKKHGPKNRKAGTARKKPAKSGFR